MATDINSLIFPISRITEPRIRRALIHSFKDESAAIDIVEVLTYLALNYLAMIKDHKRLLTAHDGFMEKSYKDISFYTGLMTASGAVPKREIGVVIKVLEKTGLIETSRGGLNNAMRIKVNLPELEKYITEAEESWDAEEQAYRTGQKEQRENVILKLRSNLRKGYNVEEIEDSEVISDRLNRLPDTLDLRDIKEALTGTSAEPYWAQVWMFSYYYEKYTGMPFWWSGLRIETFISVWKNQGLNELAISAAIRKALDETRENGFNAYPDFERRFRLHYSPYLKSVPEGVLFDNLRNL